MKWRFSSRGGILRAEKLRKPRVLTRVNERAKPCTPFDQSVHRLADATIVREREDYVTRNERRVICRLALHKRQLPRHDDLEKFRDGAQEFKEVS